MLDNGSTDGTPSWLAAEHAQKRIKHYVAAGVNVGIHKGLNTLLDRVGVYGSYDLLVTIDNDCEIVTPGTLAAVAEHILEKPEEARVVSPLILGLRNPPQIFEVENGLGRTNAIGGCFLPIPPVFVKEGFRYDEEAPVWGGDDERICAMAQVAGGYCGYLVGYEANHYLTTVGQGADIPEYFARRVTEGGPPL